VYDILFVTVIEKYGLLMSEKRRLRRGVQLGEGRRYGAGKKKLHREEVHGAGGGGCNMRS
jgi:hypothetical protein